MSSPLNNKQMVEQKGSNNKRKYMMEKLSERVFLICALLSVFSLLLIIGFVLGARKVLDEAALFLELVHFHAFCGGEGVRVVAEPPFDRIVCEVDIVGDEAQCRVVPEGLEHQLSVRKVHAADKCFVGASFDPVGESVSGAAYVLAAECELYV